VRLPVRSSWFFRRSWVSKRAMDMRHFVCCLASEWSPQIGANDHHHWDI
jgi:hypothetical protein